MEKDFGKGIFEGEAAAEDDADDAAISAMAKAASRSRCVSIGLWSRLVPTALLAGHVGRGMPDRPPSMTFGGEVDLPLLLLDGETLLDGLERLEEHEPSLTDEERVLPPAGL